MNHFTKFVAEPAAYAALAVVTLMACLFLAGALHGQSVDAGPFVGAWLRVYLLMLAVAFATATASSWWRSRDKTKPTSNITA